MQLTTSLVLLLVGCPGAAADPARTSAMVDALPILGEIGDGPTRVIVRGNLDARTARRVLTEARGVYRDVNRRFVAPAPAAPRSDVTLCVLASEAAYQRFIVGVFGPGDHSTHGFYRADHRLAVANLARGIGNVRHELVHPLLGDDFPGIPSWLNEGIAALYGSSTVSRRQVRFLINYRLRDLHAAIASGTLPSIAELAGSDADETYGPGKMTHYAMARYLLLYLERAGQLETTYRDLRSAAGDVDRRRRVVTGRVDEDGFVAWARTLTWRRPARSLR